MTLFTSLLLPLQALLTVATLFLFFAGVATARRVHQAGGLSPSDWGLAAALLAGAAALRLLLVPALLIHTNFHALYFLENALGPRTTDLAELIGRAPYGMTNYSFFQLFWAYLPRSWPLYAAINGILAAATVPLLYLLVRLLGGSRWWAGAAGLLLMLLPAHIKMSPTESDMTVAGFFAMVTLVHWAAWLRKPGKLLLAGTAAALLLTVNSRVLTLAFPAALLFLAFAMEPGVRARLNRLHLTVAGAIWALLAWPQYLYILSTLTVGDAADEPGRLPEKLDRAFHPSSNLLMDLSVTPAIVGLLTVVGAALLIWQRKVRGVVLVGGVTLLAVLYHIHSSHLLDQLRYQFFLWPFVALLATYAVEAAATHWPQLRIRIAVLAGVTALLLFGVVRLLPFLLVEPPSSREAAFVLEAVSQLPEDALLVESPPLATVAGQEIPPVKVPLFVLEEAGLSGESVPAEKLAACTGDRPLVIYVGLQNYVATKRAPCRGQSCFRLAPEIEKLGCNRRALVTTSLDTAGPSPGPGYIFRVPEATVGFYLLTP